MLYRFAHILRDRFSCVWSLINVVNAILFSLIYSKKLEKVESDAFRSLGNGCRVVRLRDVPVESMLEFFKRQPEESFNHFHPHGFDEKALKRLQRNKAFLGYVVVDKNHGHVFNKLTTNNLEENPAKNEGNDILGGRRFAPQNPDENLQENPETENPIILGYCFLRCFVHGKGFRGRIVDWNHRNKGIGTEMNRLMNKIGFGIGLGLFESISLENPASCRSVEKSGGYEIIERLDESNLFVRIERGDGF